MFNKNQEVICINGSFEDVQKELIPNRPVQDKLYTIRDIFKTNGKLAVHLNEITNPNLPIGEGENGFSFEPSFSITRFAPLLTPDDLDLANVQIEELTLESI